MSAAVRYFDGVGGRWHDGVAELVAGGVRVRAAGPDDARLPRLDGVLTGGFTDAHVHLQLVDAGDLADSVLGAVVDLGGNPAVLAAAAAAAVHEELRTPAAVHIGYAGAFLTPPGGYPSDRAWAPAGSVREVDGVADARAAVAEMKAVGAGRIKVAANSTAGPVFDDDTFSAVVAAATAAGLPVVAHAEGPGEARRAGRLGARALAHAPFSERLSDDDLAAHTGSVSWISTLAIHDGEAREIATDNVRRFHALGGTVLYGTDMGNGPTPVGLNPAEVTALRAADITGADLLLALQPQDPTAAASRILFFPAATPDTADPLNARLLTPADLELR